jgi:transposase
VLTIIWHLLANPQTHYRDLGTDVHQTIAHTAHRQRDLIHQLEGLTGKKVTLHPRSEPTAS